MLAYWGMATPQVLRDLTNEVWIRDNWDTRLVIADGYDELGRPDIAALWRDELPRYRRRKRIAKLSDDEFEQISRNMKWYVQNVQLRTGPSDEQLALAAIGCLYRANARRRSENVVYPRVAWFPAPNVVRRNVLNAVGNRREDLGDTIWYASRAWDRNLAERVERLIYNDYQQFDRRYSDTTYAAGNDEDMNLSLGLSGGQFNKMLLTTASTIDVFRLYQGTSFDGDNNERSVRASLALMRCTPFYYSFERACILSQHPTVIDADQPRWAWLDSENNPYQWPTTR